MNKTAQSERKHIAFVGRRNVGKSSLVNRFIGQDLVIVSETPGTTTDPVKKAMELLPFGPVVLIDTAGIDDVGELGQKRISKTVQIISEADFAVLVLESQTNLSIEERNLIDHFRKLELAFTVVINKSELGINYELIEDLKKLGLNFFNVSCADNSGIDKFKEKISGLIPSEEELPLVGDLVKPHDIIVLVVPIDLGAPKGRLIMPQVQTIRESLDVDTIVMVVKDKELRAALSKLNEKPKLVITDSQAIMRVNADVPEDISLTTFSILMARYKGDLKEYVKGLTRVEELKNGDKVLIAEACSHHAQEDDIGKVKIPRWLRLHTKKDLDITIRNGNDYPENLSEYKLIVHCGGCLLTRRSMQQRIKQAKLMDVPIVNYGVLISYMHGAVPRALQPFEEAISEWNLVNDTL
ncbi:MAG: [FeFe] hydrogenase H-cluster maturation GTPase HydF [Ignavibacteriae bacterium HGW-Ignavibacteriae-2]|nr:MAG: [FeFe] hydrogenase H-cluster maturation GTPase HydF [Ignavibacteriae bacterium HGW-Ignavibacteriae-2]